MTEIQTSNGIGILREQSLHAQLKVWLAEPGDLTEQLVDGYHIDILRPSLPGAGGDSLLIEIQTGNFSALKRKLPALLDNHRVKLVYPIPQRKWILRQTGRGKPIGRRKSPKNGRLEHLFDELVSIPQVVTHPNFRLLVLLTEQEEIWKDDGQGSWRRAKWSIADRRLLQVTVAQEFIGVADFLKFLPEDLPDPFSNRHLSTTSRLNIHTCRKITYCLRHMGALEAAGKDGHALLFRRL
jgi:hypothetical protein